MSRLHRAVPIVLAAVLALTGCATASAPTPSPTIDVAAPVTVDNCGVTVTFDTAPERVVTIELHHGAAAALGLGDRIVGTAFQDGPVPAEWADAARRASRRSPTFAPNEEAVLQLSPHPRVRRGSRTSPQTASANVRSSSRLGVNTYVAPSACAASSPRS